MRPSLLIGAALVAALAVVWSPLPAAGTDPAPAGRVVVPVQLEPVGRTEISLNQSRLLTRRPQDTQASEIPIRLRETLYKGKVLEVSGETTREWTGSLFCYELDSDAPYTWAVWSLHTPLSGFRLFTTGPGRNYLAWVQGPGVMVAEVSEPKDRCLALSERFSSDAPPGIMPVPVGLVVPGVNFWGPDAINAEITILLVDKDEGGNWTVKISGPDSPEVYTLVSENGEWRRQE